MITIQIEQFYIRGLKKIPANCRYSMVCYFEEHVFKTWTNVFLNLQECSHYAEGFLLENLIEKDVQRTDRTHAYFEGDDNQNLVMMKAYFL
jgi:hypothetical protein